MPTSETDTNHTAGCDSPEGLFARIFELARPHLQTRNNDAHARISHGWALRLLAQGGDPAVVIPAILLHDVGWSRVPAAMHLEAMQRHAHHPGQSDRHETEGARIAAQILDQVDYPQGLSKPILAIIAEHDSKSGCDSLEEAIVKDADKLYRYSPEAFRWFQEHGGMEPQAYLAVLERFTGGWFLTKMGGQLASEQLAACRAEWGVKATTDR